MPFPDKLQMKCNSPLGRHGRVGGGGGGVEGRIHDAFKHLLIAVGWGRKFLHSQWFVRTSAFLDFLQYLKVRDHCVKLLTRK